MKRVVALVPESITELCLIRLGIQARGLRALLFAARLARAIDREAAEATASGLLRSERFTIGRGHFGVLQYWRSFEDLEAWSRRPPHSEWWRSVLERMRIRGDVGVYHETFLVPRASIETIALDCAPAGIASFGATAEPVGPLTTSRGRLGRSRGASA